MSGFKHLKPDQFAGSNFHYIKHTLDYFLASMDRLNIHYIEFYMACPHFSAADASAADVRALRRRLNERGQKLCCTTYEQCTYPVNIASEDPVLRERSIRTLERVIEQTAMLDCPYTQVLGGRGSYDLPESDAWKRAAEALSRLAERGAECGVTMVIEEASRATTNTVYTTPLTRKMLDEVNSPNFKAMLDICATATAGEDFRQCVQLLGPDFRHMHFADGTPGGHFVPGGGSLDLEGCLQAMDDADYSGAVTFELYNKSYETEPELYMKQCFDYLDRIFQEGSL